MIRTQVQLTEAQAQVLKRVAAEKNVSTAELIRQAVDLWLQTHTGTTAEERRQRAVDAVGQFRSGQSDVSDRHDDYLTEAFSA
jgi:Arc/MetJ-type ribon-helix-helix transcriptional regulator